METVSGCHALPDAVRCAGRCGILPVFPAMMSNGKLKIFPEKNRLDELYFFEKDVSYKAQNMYRLTGDNTRYRDLKGL